MHMRFYLGGVAKIWHDIRATEKAGHPWADWRQSFLATFCESKFRSWDRAIAFRYLSGPVTYFFEKWRLLHAAGSALSDSSLVCLITLGLSECMQRHVQLGTPRTPEELLQIMKVFVQQRQSSAREVATAEMFPAPG
ncbi:hypothetical protein MTO96_022412 [Rhipicephalus appendiculatus]